MSHNRKKWPQYVVKIRFTSASDMKTEKHASLKIHHLDQQRWVSMHAKKFGQLILWCKALPYVPCDELAHKMYHAKKVPHFHLRSP